MAWPRFSPRFQSFGSEAPRQGQAAARRSAALTLNRAAPNRTIKRTRATFQCESPQRSLLEGASYLEHDAKAVSVQNFPLGVPSLGAPIRQCSSRMCSARMSRPKSPFFSRQIVCTWFG